MREPSRFIEEMGLDDPTIKEDETTAAMNPKAVSYTHLDVYKRQVARAARASSKHRRAFWALMRKHGIDAAPYRRQAALHAEDAADAG